MKILLGLLLGLCFLAIAQTGQLSGMKFLNQWEKPVEIKNETKIVLFSYDMGGSDAIKAALDELKVKDLSAKNWVYVADISNMPALISKMFAMPKMKKYPYAVALDKEGDLTKDWQRKADNAAVLILQNGSVQSVEYFANEKTLREFLNSQP